LGAGVIGMAGGATGVGASGRVSTARARLPVPRGGEADQAYDFLDFMMDAYQSDGTLRLIQSYSDQGKLGSTAFVYDNALAICAYLVRGRPGDVSRAQVLGDSLLYAQEHDPAYNDGRLRQAYWVGPFRLDFTANSEYFVRPDGSVNLAGSPFDFQGSAVGDMAWAAIALARLHVRTGDRRYLDGAVRLGRWIVDNALDTVGLGGYSFGVNSGNHRISATKSSEHNIDACALFANLLAPLTGDASWAANGQHARDFIDLMWNAEAGFLYAGSNDGTTINHSPIAVDVQAWSVLALPDRPYARGLDWAKTNLVATDTPQSLNTSLAGNLRLTGVTFSSASRSATARAGAFDPLPDPDAVWLEGTAQMVAALELRQAPDDDDLPTFHGDADTAQQYLAHIRLAQATLGRGQAVNDRPIPEGNGIVATTSPLNSGFGFSYLPNLHVGATAWYLIAAGRGNPYQL
jgi:hypothetical protein